jgi:hypothetical protein
MNVPCPFVSRYCRLGFCDSSERSGPLITLPDAFRPATGATPVSMTATSTPLPVYPAFNHDCAPSPAMTFCIE